MRIVQICFILFLSLSNPLNAQLSAIYFKDKTTFNPFNCNISLSQRALERRHRLHIPINEKDISVNSNYLSALKVSGVTPIFVSRWFNACFAFIDNKQTEVLKKLPFIKKIEPIPTHFKTTLCGTTGTTDSIIGYENYRQLQHQGSDSLFLMGLTGKGILIAIFDNGFMNADTLSAFRHIITTNKLIATKNFVAADSSVFFYSSVGDHGTRVLSLLAASIPGRFSGSAPDANYALAVTEDNTKEVIGEELNWLAAAEWADSIGADIINSSLGYFSAVGHKYEDLDGDKTIITQAADIAASKGILVVNSAGNEGSNFWQHIIAPADADSILAVGSVDSAGIISGTSSKGPASDNRTKPDVVGQGKTNVNLASDGRITYGNDGTSWAAPLISGLAACLWQSDSGLSNMQLIQAIKQSGNRAQNPDNLYGWGMPNGLRALSLLKTHGLSATEWNAPQAAVFPNPVKRNLEILFPKTLDETLQIEWRDLSGRVIHTENLNLQGYTLSLKIPVDSAGCLMLKVTGNDGKRMVIKKIIIAN